MLSSPALLAGDLAVIGLFLFLGTLHHNRDPLDVVYFLDTAAPFVLGWVAASFAVGTYGWGLDSVVRESGLVVVTWVVADAVGLVLRSTSLFHGGAAMGFVLVSLFGGAVFLLVGRGVRRLVEGFGRGGRRPV